MIVLHPAVAEVAVIGLPDAEWGEAVTAFVVARARHVGQRARPGGALPHPARQLQEAALDRFVASLPRSHYGKVLRAQLVEQANSE